MDFYRAQDEARRKTGRLVLLFVAAVLTLVLLTNVLMGAVYLFATGGVELAQHGLLGALSNIPLENWLMVSFGVIGVVSLAVGFKFLALRAGGKAIAESLGGQPLSPNTADRKQKQLLNVVEEMALASGIPVPPVYLIPEPSINAFAAGYGTGDAVLGFNQGTVDALSRDELQGVVAHEFSHLLHGDTRINLRLIALLHGILFLGLVGRIALRGGSRSSRSNSKGGGGAAILLLGIGLLVIGYGGTFFGNLIKAAVSRQREYLADGSAVQFTRNPQGIAGALKKIGGSALGSQMSNPKASQASHMFFGEGIQHFLGSIMATHPPLPERILAIEPNWDGNFVVPQTNLADAVEPSTDTRRRNPLDILGQRTRSGFAGAVSGTGAASDFDVLELRVSEAPQLVGNPNDDSHETAVAVLNTTVASMLTAAHEPASAHNLAYALLLASDKSVRQAQLESLSSHLNAGQLRELESLFTSARDADALHRLSLINAAMPALKQGSSNQYRQFLRNIAGLMQADQRIDLFEWVMHRVLVKELKPHFERPRPPKWRYGTLSQVVVPCVALVSAVAQRGNPLPSSQTHAFEAGLKVLGFKGAMDGQPDPNFKRLNGALNELSRVTPLAKPRIIKACAATVLADELVTVAEGALLQGISATLDCPLPPAIYEHLQARTTQPGAVDVR